MTLKLSLSLALAGEITPSAELCQSGWYHSFGCHELNEYYCRKTVSHAINSHVLTSTNPCINKAIHVLLMHGFAVL